MFILKADDCGEFIALRQRLLKNKMPCGIFSERDLDEGRVSDRVCIVCHDPNRAMKIASSDSKMKVILHSDRVAVFQNVYPLVPGEDSVERIQALLEQMYEDHSLTYTPGRVFFADGIPYFRGLRLSLTPSETLILRHLAINRGRWISAAELSEYCFAEKGKSPVVHICNINKRIRSMTERELIETARFSGYRVL